MCTWKVRPFPSKTQGGKKTIESQFQPRGAEEQGKRQEKSLKRRGTGAPYKKGKIGTVGAKPDMKTARQKNDGFGKAQGRSAAQSRKGSAEKNFPMWKKTPSYFSRKKGGLAKGTVFLHVPNRARRGKKKNHSPKPRILGSPW